MKFSRHISLILNGFMVLAFSLPVPQQAWADNVDDLLFAARFNAPDDLQELLDQGLSPNTREKQRGETLLMLAVREKANKVVAHLLKNPKTDIEAKAKNGDTALMLACFIGNMPAIELLLKAGAEVNQPGWAPLHYAAANGNPKLVHRLLEESAYIDAESPNKTTPLMMAVRSGKYDAAALLIQEGADVSLRNDAGYNASDFAKESGREDLVSLFSPPVSSAR